MSAIWADLQQEKGPFFKVLASTPRSQTGFMTVPPGTEAGPPETHDADQVFYFVEGRADVKVWGDGAEPEHRTVGPGTVLVVPEGVRHWVKSVGEDALLFFTVYAPPAY